MPTITTSLVTSKDVEEIRDVQREVWLATYPNDAYGITTDAIQAQFADKKKTSTWIHQVKKSLEYETNFRGWIVKIDNKIVGYCFVTKMSDKNRILSIYVLPTYQHQGIGKRLMNQILIWIDKSKPTVLEVASYNTSAISFYKTFQFIENGPTKNEVAAIQTGIVIPEIEMTKHTY